MKQISSGLESLSLVWRVSGVFLQLLLGAGVSRMLLCTAVTLIAMTYAASAGSVAPLSINQVSGADTNLTDMRPLSEPELGLPQAIRRRRIKLQFAHVVDWLPWGVVVVDERLQIVYASRRALRALASGTGLSCKKGILCTERASIDRALREIVRLALSSDSGFGEEADVIGIPDKDGQLRYALRVMSAGDDLDSDVAIIAISDLSARSGIRRDAVGRLFCLSEREAEFAELFALGCRVQEIALQMNVAVNTARVHLRNVFQKTGCSSQLELARKFSTLL